MRRRPAIIASSTHAHLALEALRSGQASAVKTMRAGTPQIVIRSEVPPLWVAKVRSDYAHVFEDFFENFGCGDGLLEGCSQTARKEVNR
jgi:hypothetical protein